MCIRSLLAATCLAVLSGAIHGCERPRPVIEIDGRAMGTSWRVQIVAPPAATDPDTVAADVAAVLDAVESLASTYRPQSALSKLNAAAAQQWHTVPGELCGLLETAAAVGAQTGGAYDITIGSLVDLWGFGAGGDFGAIPPAAAVDAARLQIGRQNLDVDCRNDRVRKRVDGLRIDLSASAKGYGVDRVAARLQADGFEHFLVEVGGEIRVRGTNRSGERFGLLIEHPADADPAAGVLLRMSDAALATSGDYRNVFVADGRRYSHALDPRSGYPIDDSVASVSVVAANCETADALATALLVMGAEAGLAYAEANGIAALFQLRAGDSILRQSSSAFAALQADAPD